MRRFATIVIACAAALAFTAPAMAGGGGCYKPARTTASADDTASAIVIDGGCVTPTVLTVGKDRAISWVNKDVIPHTITSGAGLWVEHELVNQNSRFSYTFSEPGLYPWYCRYHLNMGGVVAVEEPASLADSDPPTVAAAASDPVAAASTPSIPVVVIPAIAAAAIGFAAGRRHRSAPVN